jgi:hypothetical protein
MSQTMFKKSFIVNFSTGLRIEINRLPADLSILSVYYLSASFFINPKFWHKKFKNMLYKSNIGVLDKSVTLIPCI